MSDIKQAQAMLRMAHRDLSALKGMQNAAVFADGPAKRAFALRPGVLGALKPDVAGIAAKAFSDGMRAIGVFGAIHAAPRQQAGQAGDANAKHLLGQYVVDALLQVLHLLRQALGQAAGDFAQKNA